MFDLSFLVIDNFYRDPDIVRSFALSLPFTEASTKQDWKFYKGRLSSPYHPFVAIGIETISAALHRSLSWQQPHGDFRLLYAPKESDPGGETWIHTDSSAGGYSAVVFLNPPHQCRGGISFFTHVELGLDRLPSAGSFEAHEAFLRTGLDLDGLAAKFADEGYDIEGKWERTSRIAMKFNRCVVFDAKLFHARSERFGLHRGEARLTQNFFFNIV